jgi:hypothetical protein
MTKDTHILPTDSVIVEALDKYSIKSRMYMIKEKQAQIEKRTLANSIIQEKDDKKAEIYRKVYPSIKL